MNAGTYLGEFTSVVTWVESVRLADATTVRRDHAACGFRYRGSDEDNQGLLNRLNASGDLYLTHTRLNDQLVLRLCIGQTYTEHRHVARAWARIQEEATASH